MRVTIAVHDHRTQKSYQTRAFPSGQEPGVFSAALDLDSKTHWVHVKIGEREAEILGGNKVRSKRFKLEPVHQSHARLINGTAFVEYDVAQRFRISINVQQIIH